MSWYAYGVEYELLSPLHIGYHRVGNVQRTRYYVPARNLWGAMTERLTRAGFWERAASERVQFTRVHSRPFRAQAEPGPTLEPGIPRGDYQRVGQWLRAHCAFGYLFVCHGERGDDRLLYPCYSSNGLRYGNWTEAEFERHYLAAHVTTALDPASTSAQAESLHEVEYVAPYDREGRRTRMRGWVWLDDVALERFAGDDWRGWPDELQAGGERRYGFGRLRLCRPPFADDQLPTGYAFDGAGDRPRLSIEGGKPLLAHALVDGISARGMAEPVVGRETGRDSERFGQHLTAAQLSWTPGSITLQETFVMVDEWGTWRAAR
jgi:hypothetical protein